MTTTGTTTTITTTTTTTTTISNTDGSPSHPPHSIPLIDLHLLSQSDLYSLSKSSNSSSFDLNRCDDVVIPKINRSVFNESAGSRKQTYSKLRLAPADSASSAKTTVHRRTRHLRASCSRAVNDVNDPEQVENSRIIFMLKELFKSNPKFSDLASNDVENENYSNFELLNPEIEISSNVNGLGQIEGENDNDNDNDFESLNHEMNYEMKRKRGRPKKHENAVFISPSTAKRMRSNNIVKKEVVYDNDRDLETMNCRGVKVDFVNLARLEDPYGPEIRRRTEGMLTSDELLGFLRGLNGEWGTTRKKRRVVDASDFGDFLPKGWRLSLCIKRKEGRVWLFCRRYISLSGRQFESCKDISMYLLSIVGEEILDKPNYTHNNNCDDSAIDEASGNAAYIFVREDLKRNSPLNTSTPPVSLPTHCEKQVPVDVRLEAPSKIDLLDHQVLAHKDERSQLGSTVPDIDRDLETVNCRGVKVNMADLGRLEDPYGPEILRRTEGMSTADELLGFLRGLNGEWGTTRKKRRVVDASDFGDFLPKGWRLSLCIKRKGGRVWLFCRRYLSPSGRQFESCKDVSMYLFSIVGEENLDEPNHPPINNCDDSALNGASGNAADLFVREDVKQNIPIHNASTPPISVPTDCEKQVPVNVQVEELFKCLKCFMIFEGKINLLDHQALAHHDESSQLDAAFSDWSIVIGGIFDCRFCHKTFYERNQYNGHIEAHVTNEKKTSEASEALTAEKVVDESNDVRENYDEHFSDHKISSGTESKTVKRVHDLNMNGDVLVEDSGNGIGNHCNLGDNEAMGHETSISNGNFENSSGTVDCDNPKSERVLDHRTNSGGCLFSPLSNEESGGGNASNGQNTVLGTGITHVDNRPECILEQGKSSGNSPLSSFANQLMGSNVGIGKTVIDESASVEVLRLAGSETRVPISTFCEKKDFQETTHMCSSFDELTSEKEKVVNSEALGVFHSRLGLDEESKKLSESETLSFFSPIHDTSKAFNDVSLISSKKQVSPKTVGFHQVTCGFDQNRFSYPITSSKLDGQYEVRNTAFDSYNMSNMDGVTSFEKEDNFKSHSSVSPWRKNKPVNEHVGSNNASSTKSGVANLDDFQFCSLAPPGNEQAFDFQDDVTGLYDSTQESCEKVLLDQFCVAETSDDIFGLKFDQEKGMGVHELSLAFGNPNDLYADAISVDQKKDGVSKIEDSFDVQTDLSIVNNSMVEDLKRGSDTRDFQQNGNVVYQGRTWEDFRSDEFRSFEDKKFMIGSGSNQHQQRNEVVSHGMLKTAQGNQLQSGLVNPHAQIQSPSFHSFDIMSDKAEDGLYRVNERYNDGLNVSGLRSNRSEPVEYRFLTGRTEHNPQHAFQGGSRAFPYNTGMEQAFDSTFWMEKNVMMSNMANSRIAVTTSVCAWCRNEFHLPSMAMNPQTQGGVGSLCPTCSAGFSGQANML